MQDVMGWKEEITFGIAAFGAVVGLAGLVLGLYNAWAARDLRRVHLRVMLVSAPRRNSSELQPAIEVTNLSAFAVTVSEVGFVSGWRRHHRAVSPLDLERWPQRIPAHDAATIFFDLIALLSGGQRVVGVYAKLASGEIIEGQGPELKPMRRMIRSLS